MPIRRAIPGTRLLPTAFQLAAAVAAVLLAGCGASGDPAQARALVFLQQAVRRDTGYAVHASLPDDSTLAVTLDAPRRGARRSVDSRATANRVAVSAARHWPDPRLRTVSVELDTQARLGPLNFIRRTERFSFAAGEVAAPPELPPVPR